MWKWLTILLLISPAPPPAQTGTRYHSAGNSIISCSPSSAQWVRPDGDGRFAPPFPGLGHHHYAISTADDSAQYYFDQGLSLYYSYHLAEAIASFKEAELKDSLCAMAWWGDALAHGPYYNSTYTYKMPPEVPQIVQKMNELASRANAKEKDLMAALNQRYSDDTTDVRRKALNAAWSLATKALIAKYPADNDIKALYIDGVMTEHAWDLWDNKGNPRSWTPELLTDCEEILQGDPDHPAALHYHIHLLEASLHPEATLASANRLKDLMPGVAHMVHMASHSYQRTGHYEEGVAINEISNANLKKYSILAPQLKLPSELIHYDAVEAFCGMSGAMFEKAFAAALRCRVIATERKGVASTNLQYLSMMPEFVLVRMGKWREILDQPTPNRGWVYASLISHFARGMANIRLSNQPAALRCLDSLEAELKDPILGLHFPPFNEPVKGGTVAKKILEGEILYAQNRHAEAIAAFRGAIDVEDEITYLEPKEWPLPAREFAAYYLHETGNNRDAERLYREDLAENPGNGWSLAGLAAILGEPYRSRATTAFAQAEKVPTASIY